MLSMAKQYVSRSLVPYDTMEPLLQPRTPHFRVPLYEREINHLFEITIVSGLCLLTLNRVSASRILGM